jgi:hypothetical protein
MASEFTKLVANFSTSITSNVSIGGLTTSLQSAVDKEGNAIPAGKYCFTLNQGKSNEQHFLCDVSGVNITNVQGVTHQGITSTGFLKEARVNDPIKITDFVELMRIIEVLSGGKALDGGTPIKYDAAPALTTDRQIPDRGYVNAQDALKMNLAGANIISASNVFNGPNTFSQSPTVPNPINPNDAVNYSTLLGIAFGTILLFPGFNTADVRYDDLGRISSVYDAAQAKTFFIRYKIDDQYVPYMISTNDTYWIIDYVNKTLISTKKN